MPKRKPDPEVEAAAHENFFYLLAEMEASLERGTIPWTEESAQAAWRRLLNVFGELGVIAARLRHN